MRLLVVAPHVPYEGIPHAGGVFLLRHLERLRPACSLTLVAPRTRGNVRAEAVSPAWLEVLLVEQHPPAPGTLRHEVDRVRHRLRGWSPQPHELRDFHRAGLAERAAHADLVELHWPEYAHLAPRLRRAGVRAPMVVVEHDVASQAEARRYANQPSLRKRLTGRVLQRSHRAVERRALSAVDLVLVFKQGDADLLHGLGLRTPAFVLDPWLDQPSAAREARDASTVLFTGALWRLENQEAVRWLVDHVWPSVRAAVPSARLLVVGGRPSTAFLGALAAAEGVDVVADVPDLEPFYLRAGVFVAPLHVGGGLKFKVPQAMLYDLPVIATSVAAEGVVEQAPPGIFWALADDTPSFAAALVDALRRPEEAARTGARAGAWCREAFSFERSGRQLLAAYRELVSAASRRGAGSDRDP